MCMKYYPFILIMNHKISFRTKEYYHKKQHHLKPTLYIYKMKSIYIHKYILRKNVHKGTSDQNLGVSPHISVEVCLFLPKMCL